MGWYEETLKEMDITPQNYEGIAKNINISGIEVGMYIGELPNGNALVLPVTDEKEAQELSRKQDIKKLYQVLELGKNKKGEVGIKYWSQIPIPLTLNTGD